MRLQKIPFNITFLENSRGRFAGLMPIQALQLFEGGGVDFHPQGLYSNVIFGRQGEDRRETEISFIDMKTTVFHPLYFKELCALRGLYREILLGRSYAVWNDETKDFDRATIMDGQTGFAFFIEHFKDLEFKQGKSEKRKLRIQLLEKYREKAAIRYLVVIPAGLRDVQMSEDGRPVEDEINPLYRKAIAVSNTINAALEDKNSPLLDGARQTLQRTVEAIYDYIYNIVEGKKGFIQGSYGSRRIFGATRNVLSSMEPGSAFLGDERQPDLITTVVGLYQFMKAIETHMVLDKMPKGFMSDIIENVNGTVPLVDPKTLKTVPVVISEKQRDKWGTKDGRVGLINGFVEEPLRHRPVTIDGYFAKLIYQDDKFYRVMNNIDELPEHLDRGYVRPMTWAEMFYLLAKDMIPRTRCFNTRYPVTGLGSIYANKPYVKTTVTGLWLKELGLDWKPNGAEALEFPDTVNKLAFVGTMAVHPAALGGLGADFDGDTLSFTCVTSDDAVAEVDRLLADPASYLDPAGGLMYPCTSDVTEWVMSFMLGE